MPAIIGDTAFAAMVSRSPNDLVELARQYTLNFPSRPSVLRSRMTSKTVVLVTGTTGTFGCSLLETLLRDDSVAFVYALNRCGSNAYERQTAMFVARKIDTEMLSPSRFRLVEGEFDMPGFGLEPSLLDEVSDSAPGY